LDKKVKNLKRFFGFFKNLKPRFFEAIFSRRLSLVYCCSLLNYSQLTSVWWCAEVSEYGGADGRDGKPGGSYEGPQRYYTARVSVLTTALAGWHISSLVPLAIYMYTLCYYLDCFRTRALFVGGPGVYPTACNAWPLMKSTNHWPPAEIWHAALDTPAR